MTIITVSSKNIGNALAMLEKVTDSKNVLPILDDCIFEVKDGKLHLKAANIENLMEMDVEVIEAQGEDTFGVNIRTIGRAIANLPECPVRIKHDGEEKIVTVTFATGEFSLPVDDVKDFPVMPELNEDNKNTFTINDTTLRAVITRTLPSTAQDELRPVMNGIYFNMTEESLDVVASDGHRLVRDRLLSISSETPASFILPKKPAAVIKSMPTNESDVTVTFDERSVVFETEVYRLQARLVEGRYPNYNSVIPLNHPSHVAVNRAELLSVVKRLQPFCNQSSLLMRVDIAPEKLTLTAEDWDFSKKATESLSCLFDGKQMSIGLKCSVLVELLQTINAEQMVINLADATRAALLQPMIQPADENILLLQMPMLIND